MRVLWTHNFDPKLKNSGTFMHISAEGVRKRGFDLELCYLGNLRSVKNIMCAREQIKRVAGDFDLVHAQFGSACAFATTGAKHTPNVLSLRGSDWYRYREKWNFQAAHGLMATAMTRQVVDKFDAVVVMSNRMAVDVHRKYPNVNVITIPDPINLQAFRPIDKQAARAELGFPDDTDKWILFTTLSTKNPVKRVRLAQEAVILANQRLGGIKLRIATGLDHAGMPLFVGACDLVLSTSVYEGWPNSIKEALACNIPFVATDISDLCDIVIEEPSCRICAPDPLILADNICDVLSNHNVGNLRRHVSEMGVQTVGAKLIALYRDLVSMRCG